MISFKILKNNNYKNVYYINNLESKKDVFIKELRYLIKTNNKLFYKNKNIDNILLNYKELINTLKNGYIITFDIELEA